MVLDNLGSSLRNTLSKITGAMFVDEKLLNELVKDIQRALLQSDCNVKLVFELTKKIKDTFLKDQPPAGMSKKEWLVKIVYEKLVEFLGAEEGQVRIEDKKPFKIMLVGLFGNGKTTTSGKLAKFYAKRGIKVAMISTDTWRPAAYEQLKQIGATINVPVFGNPEAKNPVDVYKQFEKELSKFDLVIVDTAGRDALSDELITELDDIHKAVAADEKLLVIAADVGQGAEKQARAFHETCGVTGVVITKLDGTAKGGGALIACSVTGAKVKFVGVGEKVDDFEKFKPQNFVGRLLGMGDIEALLEKAKEAITEEDAQDMGKKLLSGKFNLIDLYDQMSAMGKMGPLGKVLEMVPGMGQLKLPKDMISVQEGKLKTWRFIMDSCTKEELENPDLLDRSRIERISAGSGRGPGEIRDLLKQYKQSKKMVKMMKGMGAGGDAKSMDKMMKRMGGMKGMMGGGTPKF
ncbi:signal recognition particle protein [Candidatus Woesearchaeota archaeon]|jgi:signal recognition particle subunit SRP54|nr:signal recognition particle protein [Candidatus Woesearchaeota archaeon]MBT3538341.1 signal recognition particle protein [Candidatus Woesearchaeota archaeon]MBT4698318.1 signal recognition particle protein [Candidatus Woesearchaeota archaeon]MBT4716783.1 signal recognition particle protein [Candidatus Woesearchaeota archaeon]MBT7106010.1 signal recognition particle protein [Candidatus Woesearchaeota archaeon]